MTDPFTPITVDEAPPETPAERDVDESTSPETQVFMPHPEATR